ncbi:efflux transporter outer membrane subunit [Coraliomargarita algicola]|uniref:Efflux transporter outer membrane subunit n=1 Tax=Coraliomargarita algicola TaxID=3092156 RepID=A0ABZ0RU23_9BACT|nr:efflux transporter outer membrane subunit [Coraliomargarita sp. J2-16]WPJ96454.1 efflux transporter outer membrane subunit [Coraliomargarita sp. J2-16]
MFKAIYPAVLGLSLLAGCSMAPEYQRPESPAASSYPYASNDNNAALDAVPQWRAYYANSELQHLIELALENNRDLRISELTTERIRAYYRIQSAALLPSLNASASDTRQRTPADLSYSGESGISDSYAVGLQMPAYELDFFGRILSLKDQALQQYLATEEAQHSAEIALVAAVANQYHQLVALKEQAKLASEAKVTAKRAYAINQDSFDAGVGSELDLRTAEAQYQSYRASELAYIDQVRQAQNALALLIGTDLPELAADSSLLNGEHAPIDLPVGLPSELLTQRPDIRAAEHTLEGAHANIGAARAAFFPSVQLTAFGGTASAELSDLFKSGSAQWSFSPQISLPIFSAGRNQANLDVAWIQQRIEIANYEKAIQTAFREVADALAVRRTIDQRIEAQAERVKAAQRRSSLSQQRFDAGVDSYLPVLLAQQELFSAQKDLVQAQLTKLNNQSALFAALGGGWQSND